MNDERQMRILALNGSHRNFFFEEQRKFKRAFRSTLFEGEIPSGDRERKVK